MDAYDSVCMRTNYYLRQRDCFQTLYAYRVLQICDAGLQAAFRSVVADIFYASPAWSGLITTTDQTDNESMRFFAVASAVEFVRQTSIFMSISILMEKT